MALEQCITTEIPDKENRCWLTGWPIVETTPDPAGVLCLLGDMSGEQPLSC